MVSIGYEHAKTSPAVAEVFAREHFKSGNVEPDTNPVRRPCKFTETDVRRALRAVQKEGLRARVELIPDGRISIIPTIGPDGSAAANGAEVNEWDAEQ